MRRVESRRQCLILFFVLTPRVLFSYAAQVFYEHSAPAMANNTSNVDDGASSNACLDVLADVAATSRTCTCCKKPKPNTHEYFNRCAKNTKGGGFRNFCKFCTQWLEKEYRKSPTVVELARARGRLLRLRKGKAEFDAGDRLNPPKKKAGDAQLAERIEILRQKAKQERIERKSAGRKRKDPPEAQVNTRAKNRRKSELEVATTRRNLRHKRCL